MKGLVTAAIALAALAALGPGPAVEARTGKAKMQRAEKAKAAQPVRRAAAARSSGWQDSGLRDRTTIYHPNGRINGKELFDSISDRSSGAGE